MEVIRIVGNESPGLFQRVLVELGRRKIEVDKMFVGRKGNQTTLIIEAKNCKENGRLLHALCSLQDVKSADYLQEDYFCFWGTSPTKGSDFLVIRGADESAHCVKKAAEHCLYKNGNTTAN